MDKLAKEKTVLLFLAKGFEVYEAASFVDVIGWTEEVDMPKIHIKTVGMHPQIKAHWNMTVIPDMQIDEVNVNDFDALAIPGGFEPSGFYEDGYDERLVKLIRDFHAQEKPIASICVAALLVANAGLLTGKSATTYDLSDGHRLDQLRDFGAKPSNQALVFTDGIITSVGPSTALDVAFLLVEILSNKKNVEKLKHAMRFVVR
ncbi:MAG: DJ-1/PfpI family protein [Bacteroidales bacterium]|jgi:4-methyl-5(b-hydroxyethyl)-thiazole monophosphate biosynthesis|nr:DJ-1/PfpI family protein [Bacteroidales bacterium]